MRSLKRIPPIELLSTLAVSLWVVLLAALVASPYATGSSDIGDDLTRSTVRLSLAYYAVAAGLMLLLRPDEWLSRGRGRLARTCWTLAWGAYLVHLGMAFHFYHHWSHANAVEHTREVSGFGAGVYFSHLFTLIWGADVVAWWTDPKWYATRSAWIGRTLHVFMTFIIFNATVVYESGPIRWAALIVYSALGAVALRACCKIGASGKSFNPEPSATAIPHRRRWLRVKQPGAADG
jgi:hypothetical protein